MKEKILKVLDITFWKFILVGIVNTLVGTTVMFTAYNVFHLSYWISSASNYVVGSIVSYFLNKYFTFQDRQKSGKQIAIFVINITVCYGLCIWTCKTSCYMAASKPEPEYKIICQCWWVWEHLLYLTISGRDW